MNPDAPRHPSPGPRRTETGLTTVGYCPGCGLEAVAVGTTATCPRCGTSIERYDPAAVEAVRAAGRKTGC